MNNSTNNRWLTIITIFLLTANMVTLAFLWTNHTTNDKKENRMRPPNGQVFQFLTNELKLDSLQQVSYSKLRDEHQAGTKLLRDSIRKIKDAFFDLLQQPNVDENTVQAAAKKASETEQQMELLTFRHFQKVRAICNAEQQKKFDAVIKEVLRQMTPRNNRQGPPPPREGEGPGRRPPPRTGDDFPPPPEQ